MREDRGRLFEEYLADEKLIGHTEKGLHLLKAKVPKLFDYLDEMDFKFGEVGIKEAQGYQGWLLETGRRDGGKYRNSTIATYLKAAASFYEFLTRKGVVYGNPFKEIRRVKEEKTLPRNIPKEKELDGLLYDLTRWDTEEGLKRQVTRYKVHVIAELQYATGLRISEAAGLKVSDIDFAKGIVLVREGKGGFSRIAWMNDYAKEVLRLYIDQMRVLTFSEWHERNGHLLFGTPWFSLEKLVNKTLKRSAERLGMGRFTSHWFRHSLGYHLLRNGCSIRHIQQILGHKHLKNTEVYTKVDREDLKDVLDTCHPRKYRSGRR